MTLPTAAVVRGWIPSLGGTGEDTTLDLFIARADAVLASWCGFPAASQSVDPTMEATTYTHYLDGPTSTDPRLIRLPVRPVASVTSVHQDDTGDASYATEIVSGDRVLDDLAGTIWLTPDATSIGGWMTRRRAIKVVYSAGINTGADLRTVTAISMLVAHWWQARRSSGLSQVSMGDMSQAMVSGEIPAAVREVMWPLRMPEVGLGG